MAIPKSALFAGVTALLAATTAACFWPTAPTVQAETTPPVSAAPAEPITPVPETVLLDSRKVALGRSLFMDVRLSQDGTVSCASCHELTVKAGGADPDHVALSDGVGHALGVVNAPTVFNSSLNYKQFWDGRADTLEEQMEGPIHNPKEMGTTWDDILARLRTDDIYLQQFRAIYDSDIRPEDIRDAIAVYERSLLTPDAPFDNYLRGDRSALTPQQVEGYTLFQRDGCIACHQGVNLGGNLFEKFGTRGDYFAHRGHITAADLGRYAQTGRDADKYVFRVPGLRNVALTAPYFHDGSVKTLDGAVQTMAQYQLGHTLSPHDRGALVAFLDSLTGRQQP